MHQMGQKVLPLKYGVVFSASVFNFKAIFSTDLVILCAHDVLTSSIGTGSLPLTRSVTRFLTVSNSVKDSHLISASQPSFSVSFIF